MKRAILILIAFSWALPAAAQTPATGFPPFGSFASSQRDAVNLQNLNVNFSLPVAQVPGRGLDLQFAIRYNSLIWRNVNNAWTSVTDAAGNPSWGWVTSPVMGTSGGVSLQWEIVTCTEGLFPHKANHYFNFVYTDANGTRHNFSSIDFYNTATACFFPTGPQTAEADDDSAYLMKATGLFPNSVFNGSGVQLTGLSATTAKDTNGNFITPVTVNSTETDWRDTLGRTALKYITSASSIQYQYQDTTGTYQPLTLNLQSFSVKTNFGCSGIVEYTGAATLPISYVLPNGQSYSITYEPTPGFSGYVTGRVQKVTLPTGGFYEYDYPATGNNGINCTDASATSLTRKISDGTTTSVWQFDRTSLGSGNWSTTQTDPVGNDTVITFTSTAHETSRKLYQGSQSANIVLRTINKTWATNGTPASQTTILEDASTQSQVQTDYDSFGNLTAVREYDWGSGTPVRTTTNTYLNSSPYTNLNILDRLTQTTVADSSGTIKSKTVIAYDGGALTSVTGASQHDDTNFGTAFTTRGNPTSVTTYSDPTNPATAVTKTFVYDTLGNLRTAQVNCCQQKVFNFSATTQYAYPDSVVSGPSGGTQLTASATYNSYTGLVATSTDENSKVTNFAYDTLKRLLSVTRPDNAQITSSYDDTNHKITLTTPVQGASVQKQITAFDGLGRPVTTTLQDASSTTYSIVQTQYDLLGRAYKTSNLYTSAPSYWTTAQFDPLGRVTSTALPDNSQSTVSYALKCATTTDPASKQRKSCADGLGRLTQMFEPDVASGNALTQETDYSYTALSTLAQVIQGAQTRSYSYDGLGRLTDSTTPEAGHFQFQYNSFNLLAQRTDARGVITTYGYDTLNRLSSIGYNVGSTGVPATATVAYNYDQGGAAANALGRLTSMTDGVGSETYTYDQLGETTQMQKVITGTTYTTGYQYNLAGELTQITYPSTRAVQQSYDAIGRLSSIANGATNYASGFGYNTAQQVTGLNYGNGVAASLSYSPDRLQMTSLSYAKGGSPLFSLTYAYGSAGSNNGQITGITDNVDSGRSVTYSYDALYRLTSAVTNGSAGYVQWGLSFDYDRYGNRLHQTATFDGPPTKSLSVNAATNRISTSGYAYDANGNMTQDGPSANTLVYDAENRVLSATNGGSAGAYTYDGHGVRVKKVSGSTTTVYIFSGSKVVAEYDNGAAPASPSREYIYAGSGLLATIDSSGTKYHLSDHLSPRVTTDSSGTVIGQQGHYPFGDSWYAQSTTTKFQFTSYERDAESGNDYAMARFNISRLGRFSSPDPLAGSIGDPQSLNRYAYTVNDPANLIDPFGLVHLVPFSPASAPGGILGCGYAEMFWIGESGDLSLEGSFCGGRGRGEDQGDGNRTGGGGSHTPLKELIHKLCDGIRANGGGFVTFFGGTASVSFDGNGLLNGAFAQLNDSSQTKMTVLGYQMTMAPKTTAGITWTNAPAQGREFTIVASKGLTIYSGVPSVVAFVHSLSFDGSFHVTGGLYAGFIPLGNGLIENRMNENLSTVISATDLANKLHDSKKNCEDVLSLITVFSKIGP